jgi:hypothetical protein
MQIAWPPLVPPPARQNQTLNALLRPLWQRAFGDLQQQYSQLKAENLAATEAFEDRQRRQREEVQAACDRLVATWRDEAERQAAIAARAAAPATLVSVSPA